MGYLEEKNPISGLLNIIKDLLNINANPSRQLELS